MAINGDFESNESFTTDKSPSSNVSWNPVNHRPSQKDGSCRWSSQSLQGTE
jgi:hypothetical protein